MKESTLYLGESLEFKGFSFGYEDSISGEVVFNTAMTGYPEELTDPSYSGQILCLTYPLIGNYGVPAFFASHRIHVKGLVVTDYSFEYSHWDAVRSLDDWMKENRVPGIFGVDTREIAKTLREKGSLPGSIVPAGMKRPAPAPDFSALLQVPQVSCSEVIRYPRPGAKKIVLVDFGVQSGILEYLKAQPFELIQVPWDYDFNAVEHDGIILSSGPGNPELLEKPVGHIRRALQADRPVFGIGLGHLLLARAAGASTFRMPCGHRSHNQPVRRCGETKCFITAQNNGYAVDENTLPKDWKPLFVNMNDGTLEGIGHQNGRFFSAQFVPEASLFEQFFKMVQA